MMTSRGSVLSVLAVTTILLVVQASSIAPNNNPNPVSTNHRIELHHSLHTPLDKSQVYWLFGGATVLTKKFIRLTPSTQDRRGWLWNEYPLESDNWEVEFKTEVFSKPHFGGDGFGFWVLSGDHDPSAGTNPDALIGPIFGMRNDFNGIGVMFDVYDNDNRRNNPNVFVLKNDGSNKKFNHDNDFEDDMYTTKPNIGDEKTRAHRCVADLRNTGKPARVLVKYLHKILHVYIETNEVSGWKFCLAVQFDKNFADHHLVFTAATGQVADNMDLLEVNTRYLAEGDAETDDARFARLTERSNAHRFSGPFWTLMTLFGLGLLVYAVYEFATFRQMMGSHIDAVRVCQQFNKYVLPHYAAHGLVAMLLLFSGNWWALFLNLPLLAVRGHAYATKTYLLTPNTLGGGKSYGGGGLLQVSNATRQTATIVYYALLQIYYFNRLVSAL